MLDEVTREVAAGAVVEGEALLVHVREKPHEDAILERPLAAQRPEPVNDLVEEPVRDLHRRGQAVRERFEAIGRRLLGASADAERCVPAIVHCDTHFTAGGARPARPPRFTVAWRYEDDGRASVARVDRWSCALA